jgi:hypothetical protein
LCRAAHVFRDGGGISLRAWMRRAKAATRRDYSTSVDALVLGREPLRRGSAIESCDSVG